MDIIKQTLLGSFSVGTIVIRIVYGEHLHKQKPVSYFQGYNFMGAQIFFYEIYITLFRYANALSVRIFFMTYVFVMIGLLASPL